MKTYICIVAILFCTRAYAETYYVDYAKGKDARTGTSAEMAWKHAPGDANASDTVKSIALKPGDVVLFKGGVAYRGSLEIPASGEAGKLITYKGDGWGTDKAILDGSAVVGSTWTQCTSAEQLRGNTNYRNVYYTTTVEEKFYTIDKEGGLIPSGTYENHDFIYPSQEPQLADMFYFDRSDQLRMMPKDPAAVRNDSSITDARYFIQKDPSFYEGAYLVITWGGGIETRFSKITGFDPATHTVSHEKIKNFDAKADIYYAIRNHPAYLNAPGQYWHDERSKRLYVWPRSSTNPANNEYSVLLDDLAVTVKDKNHLLIEGFVVEKFKRAVFITGDDVEIRNNVVRNCKAEYHHVVSVSGTDLRLINNQVVDCHNGIGIWCPKGSNVVVKGNLVQRANFQAIKFKDVNHGLIIDNTVNENSSQHAPSSIILTGSNKDILVAGNKVFRTAGNGSVKERVGRDLAIGGKGLLKQENVYICNNLFFGPVTSNGSKITYDWIFLNNTFLSEMNDVGTGNGQQVFINNILHGSVSSSLRSYNLITSPVKNKLAENEIDWSTKDINKLFVDMANKDCRLKAGSPAIEAGIDPAQYLPIALFPEYDFYKDIEGKPRQKGGKWSIGAYEYSPAKK